jgi:hypothetical protein
MFVNKKTYDGKPFSHHTHDHDGIPKHGPMGAHIRNALGEAHAAHEAFLAANPDTWPNAEVYKKQMKEARTKAIAEWTRIAPPGHA